jgi:hypothetical protein
MCLNSDKEEQSDVNEGKKAMQVHHRINASGHQCCQYPRTALVATPASRIEYFMPVSW